MMSGDRQWGQAGSSQLEELVHDLDVGLLVAGLISCNGCADLSQLLVPKLCCVRCCVAVADLRTAMQLQ